MIIKCNCAYPDWNICWFFYSIGLSTSRACWMLFSCTTIFSGTLFERIVKSFVGIDKDRRDADGSCVRNATWIGRMKNDRTAVILVPASGCRSAFSLLMWVLPGIRVAPDLFCESASRKSAIPANCELTFVWRRF